MSIKSMAAVSKKLNKGVDIVVGIVLALISLPIVGVVGTKFLMFLTTNAFIASFFFGNMWKSTFDSITLLFVVHPFDIGDRCEIEKVEMIVEEIALFHTFFVDLDQKPHEYTHVDLWTKSICNYERRSGCTTWGDIHKEKKKEEEEKEKEREEKEKEREEKKKKKKMKLLL